VVDRRGFLRQKHKGRLEGILGIVVVAQHPATHSQDHRTVAFDQRRESGFITGTDEAGEQVGVGVYWGARCPGLWG
jgi:hypothetical protein